jgi:hypothetical protein
MGYNRGGKRRTARLKRHKREEMRLAKKAEANRGAGAPVTGQTATVKPQTKQTAPATP